MISFEFKAQCGNAPDEVEVYFDSEGLSALIAQLEMIRSGRTDHIHLMAESWGGSHLEDNPRMDLNMPVHHVKMSLDQRG